MCIISIWCMRLSQNFFFFCDLYPFQIFFLPLSFPFSPPFSSRFLLRCIFFLAAVKSRVLIMGNLYGQSLEMGPGSITRIVGHFAAFLHQNGEHFFSICYVRILSISKTDRCAERSNLALLSAYQV